MECLDRLFLAFSQRMQLPLWVHYYYRGWNASLYKLFAYKLCPITCKTIIVLIAANSIRMPEENDALESF